MVGADPLDERESDPSTDLRDGVVPGAAAAVDLVMTDERPSRVGQPPPVPSRDEAGEPVSEVEPATEAVPIAAFEVVSLTEAVESREPLPVAGAPPPPSPAADPVEVVESIGVQGVLCVRDHFNHPDARFCAICGIDFNQQTRALVFGTRPPLGILVIDDGSAFTLDTEYVVGREPDDAPEVRSGRARPLTLVDPDRSVSRIHAVLSLSEWSLSVTDRGSANGTYVLLPESSDWVRLPSGDSRVLPPGARVAVGRRTFLYESHHVAG